MDLHSPNGQRLQLEVVGYQFPSGTWDEHDANWLNIRITVQHPRGRWAATDPSLLTWELAKLGDWLSSFAKSAQVESGCDFLEPNLRFALEETDLGRVLRVYFELESRPRWAPADGAGMDDLYVEFDPTTVDLEGAAAAIRRAVAQFPPRFPDRPRAV